MRILKRIILGLIALILIFAAIGFFLPSHFKVERSAEIAAPPEKVYALIQAPREWKEWAIWNQRDPNMQITYFGPERARVPVGHGKAKAKVAAA